MATSSFNHNVDINNKEDAEKLINAIEKSELHAYRNTRLTPEEIKDHEEMFKAYRHICGGRSPEEIKRALELLDAEEQGLLLRLPCKVGDTVWMLTKTLDINAGTMKDDIIPASITQLRGNKLNPIWYIAESKNDARDFHPSSIGKTVFLTREAAEAALKGIQSIDS